VIAGHGVLEPDSSPRHTEETGADLQRFNAAVASTSAALEVCDKILTLHPTRLIQVRSGQPQRLRKETQEHAPSSIDGNAKAVPDTTSAYRQVPVKRYPQDTASRDASDFAEAHH
jgi:hypothetical protein